MNLDQLNNAKVRTTADVTFGMLTKLQRYKLGREASGEQVAAVACLFKLFVEQKGLDPQHVMTVAGNLMSDADGKYTPEFKAIRMYIDNEL